MTNDEALDLYNRLRSELLIRRDQYSSIEYDDYLREIDTEVALGKVVSVSLKGPTEDSPESSKGEFLKQVPYSDVEKLAILLDGLALSVVAPSLMASKLDATIKKIRGDSKPIDLNFDRAPGTDQEERSFSSAELIISASAVRPLVSLLNEISKEFSRQGVASTISEDED